MRNPAFAIQMALVEAPNEACGVTIDGWAHELDNTSQNPTKTFRVEGDELRMLLEEVAGNWDGVWHSHPAGQPYPSEDDLVWHPAGKRLFIVTGEAVHEFADDGTPVAVYRG